MSNKVLIIGISSFAGLNLANYLLKKKYKIIGTLRKEKKKIFFPINKKKILIKKIDLLKENNQLIQIIKKQHPDYIIDFSSMGMVAESWINPKLYFETNVTKKINFIKYISQSAFVKKYIYISTPEIFGSSTNSISENCSKFNPSTPYASSKLAFEFLLKNFRDNKNFPLIICRFSNFYGCYQPLFRLIPKVVYCLNNRIKFPLEGGGNTKRNFLFSDDFCNAIYLTLKKGKVKDTYHFSGNKKISIVNLVKLICKKMNMKFSQNIKFVPERLGKDKYYYLNSSFTRRKLKWLPKFSLEEGLSQVINFYTKNNKKFIIEDMNFVDKNLKK